VTLIANWEVATGKVISPSLGATRTEADFANHIATTVAIAPLDSWIFILDNLNTHQSVTLVEWAVRSATPVITSNVSSLPEVVHNAAILVDPLNVEVTIEAVY